MTTRMLVTGGSGFIGSNFIHHVLHAHGAPAGCCPDHSRYVGPRPSAEKIEILNLDALTYASDPANLRAVDALPNYSFAQVDIADAPSVEKAVKAFAPDIIVHFAAESHVDRSIEAGDVFVRTNALGTQVLLDAVRRHDVGRFLHVSTDEVYGSIKTGSFREMDRLNPASPYSASKAASDLLVLAHHHTYGIPVDITRCTNNYGPRQHPEKLLPKTLSLALADRPIPIYGDGSNIRDWLYVKDHCTAIDVVLGQPARGEIYNVGADDERNNLDFVKLVLARLGKPESLISFVEDRAGHDWRYSLDSRKLRKLGWAPRTRLAEGLYDTISWMRRGRA